MIRFIQMDPTQKKTHSVGELEIFHQRKKQQEKTWKSYHKTSEGTLSCCEWKTRLGKHGRRISTFLETNISPTKPKFEDDFPFPKVGYVNSLEGII